MKIILKSAALCLCLFSMMQNECSAMQAIADEIRKGERERREKELSANPPSISSSVMEAAPETIEGTTAKLPSSRTNLSRRVAQAKAATNLEDLESFKSVKSSKGSKLPAPGAGKKDTSPLKSQEHTEKFKYVGGQRIVTPGKKPEEKK